MLEAFSVAALSVAGAGDPGVHIGPVEILAEALDMCQALPDRLLRLVGIAEQPLDGRKYRQRGEARIVRDGIFQLFPALAAYRSRLRLIQERHSPRRR